jgi:hypothetical protein
VHQIVVGGTNVLAYVSRAERVPPAEDLIRDPRRADAMPLQHATDVSCPTLSELEEDERLDLSISVGWVVTETAP